MFHKTNFGSYGYNLPCDMDGYVPEEGDSYTQFNIDHGSEKVFDNNCVLTEYGEWWFEEGFPEWVKRAVEQTKLAVAGLELWQNW